MHGIEESKTYRTSKFTPLFKIMVVIAILLVAFIAVSISLKLFDKKNQSEPEQIFIDIPPEHPAFEDIAAVKGYGIMDGYDDGSFKPDEAVTRAQFSKMMVLALYLENKAPALHTYEDAPPSHLLYSYIEAVKEYLPGSSQEGIMYFRPDDLVPIEDAAAAMTKAAGTDIHTAEPEVLEKLQGSDSMTRAQAGTLLKWYIESRMTEGEKDLKILTIK